MLQLFTIKQLSQQYNLNHATVSKILAKVDPEGSTSRWPGYTKSTFETARKEYYANMREDVIDEVEEGGSKTNDPIAKQIQEADLRAKLARAESLEIDNMERKNQLVSRKSVEEFISFQSNLFATKIKELTRDAGDDYYNLVVEEIYKDIEGYVIEKGINNVVQKETLDIIQDELTTVDGDYQI